MKSKINSHFVAISGTAIVLTLVLTTAMFYHLFQKEVMEDLVAYGEMAKSTGIFDDVDNISADLASDNVRLTVVEKDGTVIYDTVADVKDMDNHKNRPEIRKALKNGTGKSIRKSSTMDKSNFYYAILLENGNVFRVAKETGNIWGMYVNALPVILLIAGFLFVVCIFLGHFLTKSLVRPIEQMAENLDHLERVSTYKELMPFINLIRTQHENILKSARIRQDFTANVTHELKTPLTSISGYSELIENGMAVEEDVPRFAGEIHRNAKRLLSLINDILKLSEMDASSEYDLAIADVDLYEVGKDCIEMLQLSANNHNVQLHLEGTSKIISANRDLMEELVYNLCDNAIRYNKEGGNVYVKIGQELVVADDGIGISKEHQERIFERFFRVDKSRSKKTGGTGLGLAIVKHIVELHEAEIEIQSEENQGTAITVRFTK